MSDWLGVKESAVQLGYSEDYFRRTFCDPSRPLIEFRESFGPKGGRRVFVSRKALETLLQAQTRRPA